MGGWANVLSTTAGTAFRGFRGAAQVLQPLAKVVPLSAGLNPMVSVSARCLSSQSSRMSDPNSNSLIAWTAAFLSGVATVKVYDHLKSKDNPSRQQDNAVTPLPSVEHNKRAQIAFSGGLPNQEIEPPTITIGTVLRELEIMSGKAAPHGGTHLFDVPNFVGAGAPLNMRQDVAPEALFFLACLLVAERSGREGISVDTVIRKVLEGASQDKRDSYRPYIAALKAGTNNCNAYAPPERAQPLLKAYAQHILGKPPQEGIDNYETELTSLMDRTLIFNGGASAAIQAFWQHCVKDLFVGQTPYLVPFEGEGVDPFTWGGYLETMPPEIKLAQRAVDGSGWKAPAGSPQIKAIVNPCNPTGNLAPLDSVIDAINTMPDKSSVIVDETNLDYALDSKHLSLLHPDNRARLEAAMARGIKIFVTVSPNKPVCAPGMFRLGFLTLLNEGATKSFKQTYGSLFYSHADLAFYGEVYETFEQRIEQDRNFLFENGQTQRARIKAACADHNIQVETTGASWSPYFSIKTPSNLFANVLEVVCKLSGIGIRNVSRDPSYNQGRYGDIFNPPGGADGVVRVAVLDGEKQDRLIEAFNTAARIYGRMSSTHSDDNESDIIEALDLSTARGPIKTKDE